MHSAMRSKCDTCWQCTSQCTGCETKLSKHTQAHILWPSSQLSSQADELITAWVATITLTICKRAWSCTHSEIHHWPGLHHNTIVYGR